MKEARRVWIASLLGALALLTVVLVWFGRDAQRPSAAGRVVSAGLPEAAASASGATTQGESSRQAIALNTSTSSSELGRVVSCAPGTICGVVTFRGGEPCSGAACRLLPGELPQGMRFARGLSRVVTPFSTCASEGSGAFSLSAPDGYWTLEVHYPGLGTWRETAVYTGSYRRVVLERARVLALTVVDEASKPVPDVELLLLEDPYSNPESSWARADSDVAGRAEIELRDGANWFVQARHPSYQTIVIPVPTSDAVRIEQLVTLRSGIRIVGTLTTVWARAGPDAEVLIDEWAPSPGLTIRCDENGRYDSGPVFAPDAELELTARANGFAEARRVVDLAREKPVDGRYELDFELRPDAVRVIGRVTAKNARVIADLFLQPLSSGPFLEARKLTSPAVRWRPQATTRTDGTFEVGMLMAHQGYQLLVLPREGFGNALVRIPPMNPGTVHDVGAIEVQPGGSLFGYATHEDGTPAVHLRVTGIATTSLTWEQAKDPDFFPDRHAGRQDSYTNQDGRFEFAPLPGQTTYALYWGDGRMDEDRHVGDFAIRGGETIGPVAIRVPHAERSESRLTGIVIDDLGTPLESVLVEAWNGPASAVLGEGYQTGILTDAGGGFSLEKLVAAKEYRLTATDLRGRHEASEWPTLVPEVSGPLVLTLQRSAHSARPLEGIVTDSEGQPLPGIELSLHLSPLLVRCDCMSWRQTTDERGEFSFGPVSDGAHHLAAVDPSGLHRATMAEARPGLFATIPLEPTIRR